MARHQRFRNTLQRPENENLIGGQFGFRKDDFGVLADRLQFFETAREVEASLRFSAFHNAFIERLGPLRGFYIGYGGRNEGVQNLL